MIAKASAISHGGNALRYAVDKEMADIVKVNHMPDNISSTAMWARMTGTQKFFEYKRRHGRPLMNTAIRIEVSPEGEDTAGWSLDEWRRLAEDFIREFDNAVVRNSKGRRLTGRCNLVGSQYVAALHRDSKSGIRHLHIIASRIDMDGNTNDAGFIGERAVAAAAAINRQRGWKDVNDISRQNRDRIALDCRQALKRMERFSWDAYVGSLEAMGYDVRLRKDGNGTVRGYTVRSGNSIYKSSEIGKGRALMPSRILQTWMTLHNEVLRAADHNGDEEDDIRRQPQTPVTASPPAAGRKENRIRLVDIFDEASDRHHHVSISDEAYGVIDSIASKDGDGDGDYGDGEMPAKESVMKTALLLYAGYVEEACFIAKQSGGGGGQAPEKRKDEDDDELIWARRCALAARALCRPLKITYRRKQ